MHRIPYCCNIHRFIIVRSNMHRIIIILLKYALDHYCTVIICIGLLLYCCNMHKIIIDYCNMHSFIIFCCNMHGIIIVLL